MGEDSGAQGLAARGQHRLPGRGIRTLSWEKLPPKANSRNVSLLLGMTALGSKGLVSSFPTLFRDAVASYKAPRGVFDTHVGSVHRTFTVRCVFV